MIDIMDVDEELFLYLTMHDSFFKSVQQAQDYSDWYAGQGNKDYPVPCHLFAIEPSRFRMKDERVQRKLSDTFSYQGKEFILLKVYGRNIPMFYFISTTQTIPAVVPMKSEELYRYLTNVPSGLIFSIVRKSNIISIDKYYDDE